MKFNIAFEFCYSEHYRTDAKAFICKSIFMEAAIFVFGVEQKCHEEKWDFLTRMTLSHRFGGEQKSAETVS